MNKTRKLRDATDATRQKHVAAGQLVAYGNHLKDQKKFPLALATYRRACEIDPRDATIWNNIGAILWLIGDYEGAEKAARTALDLDPRHKLANANLGSALISLRRYAESDAYFDRDIAVNPGETIGLMMRAFSYLDRGDWKRGLDEYEIRMKHRGRSTYSEMPYPYWQGEDLSGKTILIQIEQGIGDTILFSRFLPILHDRHPGVKIKLCASPVLTNLMWEFRDIVELIPEGIPFPDGVDYCCFLASLPRHLGLRADAIPADPQRIRARVVLQNKLHAFDMQEPAARAMKVGIAWTGNPFQDRNHTRSIPAEMVFGLIENPNVVLYSLQCGPGRADFERVGAEGIAVDLAPDLEPKGLVQTGNAMLGLDLVITVCTSVAHLAGAIGVPCWTLLSYDPYWIWGREGERTGWYPSMRLFRQPSPGDWETVIAEVKSELARAAEAWMAKGA